MPVKRTRSAKKEEGDGIQLTWTAPVEPTSSQQIAFAPTVTPGTFNEPYAPAEQETEPSLFPSGPDGPSPRRPGHGKKKAENHIPRPPNAFILFRSSFIKSQHVSTEVETNHSTLSKIIGITWQNMPHEERQFWHSKAKAAQVEHKRKWPEYAFRPLHMKGKSSPEKRKVREVGPKDTKRCEKIAELLVEGKKGADLHAAIQEFDRDHIPPVITRFEAPLTARMYRRSSSQPAPDTDPSSPAFLRTSPKPTVHRLRAVSSQPMRQHSAPVVKPEASSPEVVAVQDDDFNDDSMPPLVLPPVAPPGYAFGTDQFPSFDFNTFVFNEASAQYLESCDPLSPLSPSSDAYGMYSNEVQSPCTPQSDMFETYSLFMNTSLYEPWPTSPAIFSSTPGTPHGYTDTSAYSNPSQEAACNQFQMVPPLAVFNSDRFDNQGTLHHTFHPTGFADDPTSVACHAAGALHFPPSEEFCPPLKGRYANFSHKPDLAHLDVSFSDFTSFTAQPLPNYTI